jgi:hypothetical protein
MTISNVERVNIMASAIDQLAFEYDGRPDVQATLRGLMDLPPASLCLLHELIETFNTRREAANAIDPR